MLRRLIKIANNLDLLGMHREAEKATDSLKKLKKYMPEDAETKEISRANLAHEVTRAVSRSLKMKMDEIFPLAYKMVNFEKSKEENIDKIKNHFKSQRTAAYIIEPKMFDEPEEVEVDDDEEGDFEYDMAKNELSTAMDAIEDLMSLLGDDEEGDLPAWVQSKITKGVDYLDSVADYMKGLEKTAATKKKKNVKLNKPFRTPGGPKKFSVYVKNDKGNIVKVNFGDPGLSIKRDNPNRRKNFRARHNCDNPGPKWKARYWSCRNWEAGRSVSDNLKGK
jgi:hypothetical protein